METIVKNKKTYKIHFIKTKDFKNIEIRVSFRNEIKKEEITIRNFLLSMLTFSTKTYPTKRDLTIRCQELYGTNVGAGSIRIGREEISYFVLTALREKYTEKGNIKACIELLGDIIFNPNVEKLKFDKESFSIVKDNIETEIKSFKENTSSYSMARLFENMDENMPYAYRTVGYLEDLEKINEENLYTYYKKFIRDNLVDIYVIGDVDTDKVEEVIEENFKFYKLNNEINPYLEEPTMSRKIKTIKEKEDISQSKLAIACKYKELNDFDLKYTLTLYNIILGVSTDSKLFRIVREKHSLAYYVYSRTSKSDHLLLISSGIEASNFNQTVQLIKDLMKDMEKGNFTTKDMEKAITFFTASLEQLEDNQYQILQNYVSMQMLGLDSIEERKKKIREVTKEDIMRVAKCIKMDAIYLLEGKANVKED